jgi:hypothetical protein
VHLDRAVRARPQFGDAVEDRLVAVVVGEPCVTECEYPIQGGWPVAADEDGWVRLLRGLGYDQMRSSGIGDQRFLCLPPRRCAPESDPPGTSAGRGDRSLYT